MDLQELYGQLTSQNQTSTAGDFIPVRLETESNVNFLSPAITGAASSIFPDQKIENEILHPDISKFGHTTNVLIYSFLDNNKGQQFTREEIRKSLESHKLALEENGMEEQHLTRIRTGKASVNYWIDRLVENGRVNKKHSNPVLFWLAR